MVAVFVNMVAVICGSLLGILFRSKIKENHLTTIIAALALCTFVIGISSAIGTNDILAVIICIVIGTLAGEAIKIDDRIEGAGDFFKSKLLKNRGDQNSRFTEGFVSACILFCVGSMTVMGSLTAGVSHDYSIIFAKSALDFVSSLAFGAAMGIGVTCSAAFILVYQGALTLLAGVVGPLLSTEVITEMNAVGGTILIGMAINMLNLAPKRIKIANMLPGIFLPILYFPIFHWIGGLLG
ncbi:MAG: DUF554 domain-containing protein [Oscillospiraceae bacterium]|nr:DUF554 domain-containing protein [Oscillospiraceae bacterium]